MDYYHVDVFSPTPFNGNGLSVALLSEHIPDDKLMAITREFRQFETVFLMPPNSEGNYTVRIFTVDEELSFAGHPVLGAGAVVHQIYFPDCTEAIFSVQLEQRLINIYSKKMRSYYQVTMDQGKPELIHSIHPSDYEQVAKALNLQIADIDTSYPMEVVSTGLPYLLVPLQNGLSKCYIKHDNLEMFLNQFKAKFVYVFDTKTLECRTWDNIAHTEDTATGSAAGPLCAYLVNNHFKKEYEVIDIHQGRYTGRPCILRGWVGKDEQNNMNVKITGEVSFFAAGTIFE